MAKRQTCESVPTQTAAHSFMHSALGEVGSVAAAVMIAAFKTITNKTRFYVVVSI